MASPQMVEKLTRVSAALGVTGGWFKSQVQLWRDLSDGRDFDEYSSVETIGFQVDDRRNLDTFMETLEAAQQLILAALHEEVANDV